MASSKASASIDSLLALNLLLFSTFVSSQNNTNCSLLFNRVVQARCFALATLVSVNANITITKNRCCDFFRPDTPCAFIELFNQILPKPLSPNHLNAALARAYSYCGKNIDEIRCKF
ncbi:14 kDa proline-rich protein DC2.15-like protein [Corchorus capsularis]|uniref:14 kDa proline-rich protein DC2.15-like protein n=1 Tax=Corchorus capsularis TaxID=210143 RepID=A0A1R3H8D7_COCAP|nr:14 kDa proline-rich protein DC2.15-like protein [Corchorus capsularis]